jgi:holliday junction DNA helicase RuvA
VIGSVRGTLAAIDPVGESGAELLVDVGGIGYDVVVGGRCAALLPPVGKTVELAVYTYMREGGITLFGFPDRAERRIFSLLISAHGVGPALGVAILGALSPAALVGAVTSGDVDVLTLVPGVGKKTAQRLVIELAERLGGVETVLPHAGERRDADGDLRDALTALGYGPEDFRAVLGRLPEEGSLEERLRLALRELAPAESTR